MIKKKLIQKPKLVKKELIKKVIENEYIDSNKLTDHIDLHKFVKKCLIYLRENKVVPKEIETISIMNYWNKSKNPRFMRNRINVKSFTFKMILTLVTYRIHYHKIPLNSFFDGMKKFNLISESNGLLLYRKKLKLIDNFLWGEDKRTDKSWFEICTQDENSAIADTCGIKINFKQTFEKVKKSYINTFHEDDNEFGRSVVFQNSFLFISFSEKLVECHKTKTMGEYRNNFAGMIQDFFSFARKVTINSKRSIDSRIVYILSQKMLLDFAMKVRSEPGMSRFFSDIKKKYNKNS